MPVSYGDSAVTRTMTALFYGDGGTPRTILQAYYGDGGVARLVFSSTFSASAPPISASTITPTPASGSSTCTPSGGVGPFTHSWAFVSGGTGINLSGTSTATVTAATANGFPQVRFGTLRDTVTDTGTGNVVLVDIPVDLNVDP